MKKLTRHEQILRGIHDIKAQILTLQEKLRREEAKLLVVEKVPELPPGPGRPTLWYGHEIFEVFHQKGWGGWSGRLAKIRLFRRTWNCLLNNNIRSIDDLLERSVQDLRRMKNSGFQTLEDLDRGLSELGTPHRELKAYLATRPPHESWWRKKNVKL